MIRGLICDGVSDLISLWFYYITLYIYHSAVNILGQYPWTAVLDSRQYPHCIDIPLWGYNSVGRIAGNDKIGKFNPGRWQSSLGPGNQELVDPWRTLSLFVFFSSVAAYSSSWV